MTEAVRTTASPAAIWTICVVAVLCLAFWLFMINYADKHPYVRPRRLPDMPGPVPGGVHLAEGGRSVAPNRELPADLTVPEPRVPPQHTPQPSAEPVRTSEPTAAPGTQPGPVPAQRAGSGDTTVGGTSQADATRAEAPTEPIPAQRSTDSDQAGSTSADTNAGGRS
jgi:hypothetical protein